MNKTQVTVTSIVDLIQKVQEKPNDERIVNALGRKCLVKAERIALAKKYYGSGIDADFIVNETCYKMLQVVVRGKTFESEDYFWNYLNNVLKNRFHDAMRTARANYNRPNWVPVSLDEFCKEDVVSMNSCFGDHEAESENNYHLNTHAQAFKNIACPGRKLSDEWLDPMMSATEESSSSFQESDIIGLLKDDYYNPKHVAIFKDKAFGDLSSKEVAKKYGLTPANVDQIFSRAKRYLKQHSNRLKKVA